jgi:uncharacterized membrane protein YuzA (DUF378 family)
MKALNSLALVLVIVGALNWGLVAIAEFDLVAEVFGEEFGTTNPMTRIIYGLVGLAGVYLVFTLLPAVLRSERRIRIRSARPAQRPLRDDVGIEPTVDGLRSPAGRHLERKQPALRQRPAFGEPGVDASFAGRLDRQSPASSSCRTSAGQLLR